MPATVGLNGESPPEPLPPWGMSSRVCRSSSELGIDVEELPSGSAPPSPGRSSPGAQALHAAAQAWPPPSARWSPGRRRWPRSPKGNAHSTLAVGLLLEEGIQRQGNHFFHRPAVLPSRTLPTASGKAWLKLVPAPLARRFTSSGGGVKCMTRSWSRVKKPSLMLSRMAWEARWDCHSSWWPRPAGRCGAHRQVQLVAVRLSAQPPGAAARWPRQRPGGDRGQANRPTTPPGRRNRCTAKGPMPAAGDDRGLADHQGAQGGQREAKRRAAQSRAGQATKTIMWVRGAAPSPEEAMAHRRRRRPAPKLQGLQPTAGGEGRTASRAPGGHGHTPDAVAQPPGDPGGGPKGPGGWRWTKQPQGPGAGAHQLAAQPPRSTRHDVAHPPQTAVPPCPSPTGPAGQPAASCPARRPATRQEAPWGRGRPGAQGHAWQQTQPPGSGRQADARGGQKSDVALHRGRSMPAWR